MHFKSLWIALSTYSVIPTPQIDWEDAKASSSIGFLPVIGVICGVVGIGWYALCLQIGLSAVLFSAVAVCIPLLITGGIHMDGYMDTVDAIASHQPKERKLEILKDPHCGAFAVLYCGIYLVLSFGLTYELYGMRLYSAVCLGFVLSRALSAVSALNIPRARKDGMLAGYVRNTRKWPTTAAMICVAAVCCGFMALISPIPGIAATALPCVLLWLYQRLAMRQFGGVTGDTTGFFLQLCELMILLGSWLGGVLS